MSFDSAWDYVAAAVFLAGITHMIVAWVLSRGLTPQLSALVRLYGTYPVQLIHDVDSYATRGAMKTLRNLPLLLLLAGVGAFLTQRLHGTWFDHWIEYSVFAVGCMSLRTMFGLRSAVPPAVLLLGPSCAELELALARLNEEAKPYRTVALIRPDQASLPNGSRWSVFSNNFRTRSLYQWRTIVFHLMDVVPLIVICDGESEPVREEVARLDRRGYADRTIRTQRDDLADPAKLSALVDEVRRRLEQTVDHDEREARQREFWAIRSSVPRWLWYPTTDWQFVAKMQKLADFAIVRFIATCKRVEEYEQGDPLEEIPSKISADEELRFLRADRALEEAGILLRSVEDEHGFGKFTEFNRANFVNKKGLLARLLREWDAAERHLLAAIEMFAKWNSSRPAPDPSALREIATAYYNLGDVYLAQSRETDDPKRLLQARQCFVQSMAYDERGGAETTIVRRRLASFANRSTVAMETT